VRIEPRLKYNADKGVLNNWRDAFKTLDDMMDEIDKEKPKKYYPNMFKEMKELNDTGAKVIATPKELTNVSKAAEVPSLPVKNLNGTEMDMKNLTGGKLTLLMTCFKSYGFDMLLPWSEDFEKHFADQKNIIQVVQLNIIEDWYMKIVSGSIVSGLKRKIPAEKHALSLIHFGRCDDFRAVMGLNNSFVGYVQLIDGKGRVRWT